MTPEMLQIFADSLQHVASANGVQLASLNETDFMAFSRDHHAAERAF